MNRDAKLSRAATFAGVAGLVGLGIGILDALWNPALLLQSYLFSYLFWLGLSLGAVGLLSVSYVLNDDWGYLLRRPLEAASGVLPLMAALFIPIALGLPELYAWANDRRAALDFRVEYFHSGYFFLRAGLYFVIWLGSALVLRRWSLDQDLYPDPERGSALRRLSTAALIAYIITASFAAFDWIMSLAADWYSKVFGLLVISGQISGAAALAVATTTLLARRPPVSELTQARHFDDCGKLLMVAVLIWAYLAFSQFLVIWITDLPHQIDWYVPRTLTDWRWAGMTVIGLHAALPFLLLLFTRVRASRRGLQAVALLLLLAQLLESFWLVIPSVRKEAFWVHWTDLAMPIGIGGLWLAVYLWQLNRRPVVARHAPPPEEVYEHG